MAIFENIKNIFNELTKIFQNLLTIIFSILEHITPIIKKFFIKLIDTLFNGDRFKMYISILLVVFLLAYYYIIYVYNLFNLKDNKFSYILSLSVLTITLTIYFFLFHRNQYKKDYSIRSEFYSKSKNKLYEVKENEKDGKLDYEFNKTNIQNTLLVPIINSFKYFFSYVFILLIPVIVLAIIFYILQNFQNSFNILNNILGLTIFITTLAIIAKLLNFNNSNNSQDSCSIDDLKESNSILNTLKLIICIIKNFIFFIPCLLLVFIDKLKDDLKLTHPTLFILLLLEILLVSMVFFIPMLYKFIIQLNGNDLLGGQGPYYLNEYKVIGTYQELYGQYNDNKKNDTSYHDFKLPFSDEKYNLQTIFNGGPSRLKLGDYSYSISFYLYLNPQANNTSIAYNEETTLFNYSNKPVILYNGKTNQLIIRSKTLRNENDQIDTIFKTNDPKFNDFKLKYQKWLNFIINYDNNIIDIFIDGKLVASKKHIPDFHGNEKISIGDIKNKLNKNGIHGGIKDIYYFSQPQQVNNIEFLYNLTKNN